MEKILTEMTLDLFPFHGEEKLEKLKMIKSVLI